MLYFSFTDCNTSIEAREGIIKSPLYPQKYPPNIKCFVSLNIDPDSLLSLRIDDLSLGRQNHIYSLDRRKGDCKESDYLSIFSDSSEIKLCDKDVQSEFIFLAKEVKISLTSNRVDEGHGFKISYTFVNKTDQNSRAQAGSNATNGFYYTISVPQTNTAILRLFSVDFGPQKGSIGTECLLYSYYLQIIFDNSTNIFCGKWANDPPSTVSSESDMHILVFANEGDSFAAKVDMRPKTVKNKCERGWEVFEDSCYVFKNDNLKNWYDARKQCQELKSDLVTIDQPHTQTFLENLVKR